MTRKPAMLAHVTHRIPPAPQALLASARAMIGRPGEQLERLLRQVGQTGDGPWNAAFVYSAGYWGHFNEQVGASGWPLPPAADCAELARFAEEWGILSAEVPAPGELFLVWSAEKSAFVHTGVVACVITTDVDVDGVPCVTCATIEGNIGKHGGLHGRGVHRATRQLAPDRGDRFIRWVDLDGLAKPAAERATPEEECILRLVRGEKV